MAVADWIICEEDGLIVVNKPAGMPTAGDDLEQPGSLQYDLMRHYRRMIWAVHQLDRDTSGLNLFVRRKALVQEWTQRLQAGRKLYLAVLDGCYDGGMVDAPVGWVGRGVRGVTPTGRAARTEFVTRCASGEATLVEATLHTGRTHQIRIHAQHVGHPIVGDARYGHASRLIARQALHAFRIEVGDGEFEASPPNDFQDLLAELELA